jgi:hypothetical protein
VFLKRYRNKCATKARTGIYCQLQPCCTKDEGRPLEAAVQAEASNHLKLLLKVFITLTMSGGGGMFVVSGEGGSMIALDPMTGEVHGYTFAAGGVGLGFGGAATVQVGIMDMNDPKDITRWGLEVSAFAAAIKGGSAQITGTGPFGNGSMGGAGGLAAGAGAGVSGMLTYTWYEGKYDLKDLPKDIQDMLRSQSPCE